MSDADYLAGGLKEMQKSNLQGGKVTILGVDYPATIGTFSKRDVFVNGGISPHMMGDAQVLFSDLPPTVDLGIGKFLDTTDGFGKIRNCKVHETANCPNYVSIQLWDLNEGA